MSTEMLFFTLCGHVLPTTAITTACATSQARETQLVKHLHSSRSSLALATPPVSLASLHVPFSGFVKCLESLLTWRGVELALHFFQEGVLLRFVHDRVERQAVVSQPILTALDRLNILCRDHHRRRRTRQRACKLESTRLRTGRLVRSEVRGPRSQIRGANSTVLHLNLNSNLNLHTHPHIRTHISFFLHNANIASQASSVWPSN